MSDIGRSILIGLALCGALIGPCRADWPQFLGPNSDGVAADAKGLARSWPAQGPKVVWQIPVGVGFAGPIAYRDSVLLLDREDDVRDVLRRLRLADGKEVWRSAYDAPGKLRYNGSRTTPATDGKLVFSVGPFGHIRAVNFADGKEVWKAHLVDDWRGRRPTWGVATAPLLVDNMVVVTPWGGKAALVAYDKATGRVVWTTPNPKRDTLDYTSPVLATICGQRMIVAIGKRRAKQVPNPRHPKRKMWTFAAHTIGVDPATGKVLWEYNEFLSRIQIASPTVLPHGRVFLTAGYKCGCAMFQVQRTADGFTAKTLWQNHSIGSHIAQALAYKGYLYGNSCDNGGGLRCVSLDGKVMWETKRRPWFDKGFPLIADGLLFILDGAKGDLVMAEASPKGYKELGRAKFLKGPKAWAPMAYADGKLLVRDQKTLACVDLMPPK